MPIINNLGFSPGDHKMLIKKHEEVSPTINHNHTKKKSAKSISKNWHGIESPLLKTSSLENIKPLLKVGEKVYAAWWKNKRSKNGTPSWHPGYVKSYKEVEENVNQYGPLRLYNVKFDDGDELDDIEDSCVFTKADYILSEQNDEDAEACCWIGVRNVVDKESSDEWASMVGWYNATIGGREHSFSHLSGTSIFCGCFVGNKFPFSLFASLLSTVLFLAHTAPVSYSQTL